MSPADAVNVATGEIVPLPVKYEPKEYLATLRGADGLAVQRELAAAYDEACAALIGPNDVQVEGGRSFKKKSAWRKLARYFNISVEIVKIERDVLALDGAFLATVTARATAPWGQQYEDVGACGQDEATGRRTITVADAIATASTRASNRAISNLIAMGEVSAEEMEGKHESARRTAVKREDTEEVFYITPKGEKVAAALAGERLCPKCGGAMWDNRVSKTNPKAPDFKCKDKACDGVIWPPKDGKAPAKDEWIPVEDDERRLPFD